MGYKEDTGKVPAILLDCELRNTEPLIPSFGSRGITVVAISSQPNPTAFVSKHISKKYQSPDVSKEKEYLDFLKGINEKGVLVYSSDNSAEFVAKYKDDIIKMGFKISIPNLSNFQRGFNKDQLYKECQNAGIPTIKTEKVNSVDDLLKVWANFVHPIILKPTRLAGGKYRLIRNKAELEPAFREMVELISNGSNKHMHSDLIAQEYIEYNYDDLYCCESYYSMESVPKGFLTVRKIRPNINRDGTTGSRVFAGKTVQHQLIEMHTKKLLDNLKWKGFAHLDWLYSRKHDQFLLCEINPRLPGFSNLVIKNGFDMGWYYYADLTGIKTDEYKFKKSLYYEALRIPGDISNSIYSIFKGHIGIIDFLRSYLRIFTFNYDVCVDVYYGNDLKLTFYKWLENLKYLVKRPFRNKKSVL